MHVIDKNFLYYKTDSCLNYLRLMLSLSNTLSLKTLIKILKNKKGLQLMLCVSLTHSNKCIV